MRKRTIHRLASRAYIVVAVVVCAWLAAGALAQLAAARLTAALELALRLSDQSQQPMPVEWRRWPTDLSGVASRNIFCSSCRATNSTSNAAPMIEAPAGPLLVRPAQLPRSELGYDLTATLVSGGEAAARLALLHERQSGRLLLASVGQLLLSGVELVEIAAQRVVVRRQDQLEYIGWRDAAAGGSREAASPAPVGTRRTALARRVSSGVRRVGVGRWEIERQALQHVLSHLHQLGRELRIVPSERKGKPNGFRLRAIRSGGVAELIGLRRGDRIAAINGRAIDNAGAALQVLAGLNSASHFSLAVARAGQDKRLEYTVR